MSHPKWMLDAWLPHQVHTPDLYLNKLILGRYRPQQLIWQLVGNNTYKGIDETTGKPVSIRIFSSDLLSASALARLKYDCRIIQHLLPINFPRILAAEHDEDNHIIVWEWIEGQMLKTKLQEGPLNFEKWLVLAQGLLSALTQLHQHGIIHRNIRPSEIILSTDFHHSSNIPINPDKPAAVYLIGFGPTPINCGSNLSETWLDIICYASPEQAGLIEGGLDPRSDLYSVGCVLFHAATGNPPYVADNIHDLLKLQMTAQPASITEVRHDYPAIINDIVQKLLKKDPHDRYQTAQAVWQDLLQAESVYRIDSHLALHGPHGQTCTLIAQKPRFIGRQQHWTKIIEFIDGVCRGVKGVWLVVGENGMGKSRFLDEIAAYAGGLECHILLLTRPTNRCYHSPGYQQIAHLLKMLLEIGTNAPLWLSDVLRRLPADDIIVLTHIEPKLQQYLSDNHTWPISHEGSAVADETTFTRALSSLWTSISEGSQPMLCLIDDTDEANYLILESVNTWYRNKADGPQGMRGHLGIVITSHPESSLMTDLASTVPINQRITLPPLNHEEVRELIVSMVGPVRSQLAAMIANLSRGNPLMIVTLLQRLIERDALLISPDGWDLKQEALEWLRSTNIQGEIFLNAIQMLTPGCFHTLSLGAILGDSFELNMLAHITAKRLTVIYREIDEARQHHLVWLNTPENRVTFIHPAIRQVILEQLPRSVIRQAHARIVEYLLNQSNPPVELIAEHVEKAGKASLIWEYALRAAGDSRRAYQLRSAELYYRTSLLGYNYMSRECRYQAVLGLAECLLLRGKYAQAECVLNLVTSLSKTTTEHVQATLIRGDLLFKRGDIHGALEIYLQAAQNLGRKVSVSGITFTLKIIKDTALQIINSILTLRGARRKRKVAGEQDRLYMRCLSKISHCCYYVKNKLVTLAIHIQGMNYGERFEPTLELAQIYSDHAPAMSLVGLFRRAKHYAQRSLEIRRRAGDVWGEGQALHYLGCVQYAASEFEDCISSCSAAIASLEQTGDYWQVHIARYQVAASYYRLGDHYAALEQVEANYKSAIELGDDQAACIILDLWARCAPGGVPEEVLKETSKRQLLDVQAYAQLQLGIAITRWKQKRHVDAYHILKEALQRVEAAGLCNPYTIPIRAWILVIIRTHLERLNSYQHRQRESWFALAYKHLARALRESRLCRNDLPLILREAGLLAFLRGKPRQAKRLLMKSLQESLRQNARAEYAASLVEYGRVGLQEEWPQADLHYTRGLALLQLLCPQLQPADSELEKTPSLSVLDRFETILNSGRQIASALSKDAIYSFLYASALDLLRAQECVVVDLTPAEDGYHIEPRIGSLSEPIAPQLLTEAIIKRRCVAYSHLPQQTAGSSPSSKTRSVLCSPLYVRGNPVAILYLAHHTIHRLYGKDDERLVDFLCAIAGAALENAEGFSQLQELNATLEMKVKERTAAADAANQAKSHFLATMSHEIRTPMNGIVGITEILLQTPLQETQRKYLQMIKESSLNLLNLLNDILDFSKIEAGKMELECTTYNLHDVLNHVCRALSIIAYNKGLELCYYIDKNVPAILYGDVTRIRQILMNLVGNAIKFTENGEIYVHATICSSDPHRSACEAENSFIHIYVKDTGIGIPTDKRQCIFEAFRQSDSTMTRRYGGTGLGLAICYQLIRLMNGRIWVESEEGQGSCFHILLPLVTSHRHIPHPETSRKVVANNDAQDNSALRESTTHQYTLKGHHVLLLSEHQTSCQTYAAWLQQAGALVTTSDYHHPILQEDHAREHNYHAIIIDYLPSQTSHGDFLRTHLMRLCKHQLVICLLPPGIHLHPELCDILTTERCFMKPVDPRELWACLAKEVGNLTSDISTASTEDRAFNQYPLKVLVADDHPVNLTVMAGILELYGCSVVTVDNGRAAVEAAQHGQYDLILLDLEMPEMDGITAAKEIRKNESLYGRSSKIYAMTAHALSGFREECLAAGMDGYLTKPLEVSALDRVLAEIPGCHRREVTV